MRYKDRVEPPEQNRGRNRGGKRPGDRGINPPSKPVPISIPERGDAWENKPVTNPPSIPDPEPPTITSNNTIATTPIYQIKPASKDVILFDDELVNIDTMADLIFEDIGGNELINISRSDLISGENIDYQLIKNLTYIKQFYGPNNLFALQNTSDKLFGNFPIKLDNKIDPSTVLDNVYIDASGNIVLEFINVAVDEEIEIQVATNGIIYEVDNYDN